MKSSILGVLVGLGASASYAQDFSSSECNSRQDCQVEISNGVVVTDTGYHIVRLNNEVGADAPRVWITSDGQFHVCSRGDPTPNMPPDKFDLLSKTPALTCFLIPVM